MDPYFVEPGYVEPGYVAELALPTYTPLRVRVAALEWSMPLSVVLHLAEGSVPAGVITGGRSVFKHVYGNTLPRLVCTILQADGTPVDLTDVISVSAEVTNGSAVLLTKAPDIIAPATDGQVRFDWSSTDFAADKIPGPGSYLVRWTLTFTGDATVTAPTTSPEPLIIT